MSRIEKYLKLVSGIGWTLFIICFLIIVILMTFFFFKEFRHSRYSGTRMVQGRVVVDPHKIEQPRSKIIVLHPSIVQKNREYIMVPIGQGLVSAELVDEYKRDIGEQFSIRSYGADYNNILFIKKDGTDSHLLLGYKAAITEFYHKETSGFLLFGIVNQDYNNDGFLNENDDVIAVMSDLAGKDLVPLTPKGTRLLRYNVDDEDKTIYLTYQQDSDNNHRFNAMDQTYMVAVDAQTKKVKSSIIDDELIAKIKAVVF